MTLKLKTQKTKIATSTMAVVVSLFVEERVCSEHPHLSGTSTETFAVDLPLSI